MSRFQDLAAFAAADVFGGGQILICATGEGWYCQEGQPVSTSPSPCPARERKRSSASR
ncbi:MAG: hypothetical protein IJ713_06265 [Oscillibacter sp.]|nr:hypothetical protein [Oscillibacter sp.]